MRNSESDDVPPPSPPSDPPMESDNTGYLFTMNDDPQVNIGLQRTTSQSPSSLSREAMLQSSALRKQLKDAKQQEKLNVVSSSVAPAASPAMHTAPHSILHSPNTPSRTKKNVTLSPEVVTHLVINEDPFDSAAEEPADTYNASESGTRV